MNQFIANTGAMNNWQQQLGDVSADVANFISGAPGISGVLNSHGTIGHPMQTAFDAAQSARGGAMGATQVAASKISDLLRQAAQAYERGDMASADKLNARAAQIEGAASSPASAGGPSTAAAGGQDGGASSAGQIMGQFGQIAGQLVQGIVQTATQGAAGAGGGAAEAATKAADAPVGIMSEDRMRELQGKGDPIQPMDTGNTRDKINPIDL